MNYLKYLPKDWQSAALIIVLVQLGMFAFLWQGQSHIKELLSNHVTGTEKKIENLDAKMDSKIGSLDAKIENLEAKMDSKIESLDAKIENLEAKMDRKFDKLYDILLSDRGKQK